MLFSDIFDPQSSLLSVLQSQVRTPSDTGFTLFTDSEGGSHMTRGSMPMREPSTRELYMQAKVRDNVEENNE